MHGSINVAEFMAQRKQRPRLPRPPKLYGPPAPTTQQFLARKARQSLSREIMQEYWHTDDRDGVRHKYGEDFEFAFSQWKSLKRYRAKLQGAGLRYERKEITQREYWALRDSNELEWEAAEKQLERQFPLKFTY